MPTDALMRPDALPVPERQLPFFKALYTMLDNPMEGWPKAVYEELIYTPPRRDFRTVYVCDPVALKSVLLDEVGDFPKSSLSQRLLRPMLGDGLLTAPLDTWKWQRRAVACAFQASQIKRETPAMASIASETLERWRKGPGQIDACEEMMRLTFEIILDTLLGGRDRVDAPALSRAFAAYLHHLGRPSLADLMGAPDWFRALLSPEGARSIKLLHDGVGAMIKERRSAPPKGDLVDLLLSARDGETGRAMSDKEVRDNLITFLAAGHETTALALTWSLFLLSQHPQSVERIKAEIAAQAGEEAIDYEIAQRLVFTRQVIQEAMRLYPPVPVLTRTCRRACELGGVKISPGDTMVIPVYALHRHRQHWRNPDHFDPDRFRPADGLDRRRFVYMPFGAGPRVCIGASFALVEATIVLATLMREVRLERVSNAPVRPLLRITMRPEGGLPLALSFERSQPLPLAA